MPFHAITSRSTKETGTLEVVTPRFLGVEINVKCYTVFNFVEL